jgi:hypothetical protein
LRILLEYYRREKKIRILLLKRLFEEEPTESFNNVKANISGFGGGNGNIKFAPFKKIIEQFDP